LITLSKWINLVSDRFMKDSSKICIIEE